MDELKPDAWLECSPSGSVRQLSYKPSNLDADELAAGWTETPLYGPEALIAIARAMQERCAGVPRRIGMRNENARALMNIASKRILSLDTEALVREYMEKK